VYRNNKNDSIKKYPKTSEILGRTSFMANKQKTRNQSDHAGKPPLVTIEPQKKIFQAARTIYTKEWCTSPFI
jgi:hypothetical protein